MSEALHSQLDPLETEATVPSNEPLPETGGCAWTIHPMLERKWAAILGVIIINAFGVVVFRLDGNFVMALLAVAVLLLSLNRFFFSSAFELTPTGITARYPLKTFSCPWTQVERWVADDRVALVTLKGGRWRHNIQLLLGANRDEALKYLGRHATGRIK